MVLRNAGFVQANRDDGRVPDRREARLDAHVILRFVFELLQFVCGADHLRMVIGITQRLQRNERIEHRRKNRGESVAAFKAFQHPLLGLFERGPAERMDFMFGKPFRQLVQPIQPQEKIAERNLFRVGREREVAFVNAFGIKLVQIHVHRAGRLEMVDDGQRHEHGARPVAHVPEIDVKPFADEQHLARNRRDVFPREQADEREIKFGKRVHPRHAAEMQRHFARLEHPRIGHRHAGELEREIRLDGGVHLRRAVLVNVPAAVRQLHGEDVVDGLALPGLSTLPFQW